MFNLQKDSIRMSRIFYALSKTKRNFLHYWLQKIIKYPGFFSFPHTPLSFCFLPQITQVRPFQNAVLHLFRVINWNYLRLSSNNHYKRKMSFWGPSGIMVTWKLSPPLMWVQKRESVQKLHVVLTWNDATEKNQYRSWLMMTEHWKCKAYWNFKTLWTCLKLYKQSVNHHCYWLTFIRKVM